MAFFNSVNYYIYLSINSLFYISNYNYLVFKLFNLSSNSCIYYLYSVSYS